MTAEHTTEQVRSTEVRRDPRGSWMLVPRTRGALSGALLVIFGAWAAVVPFIGPYFGFGFFPNDTTWTWTAARGWFDVAPGAAAFVAGLILLASANRLVSIASSWLAIAAGAWLIVGPVLSDIVGLGAIGTPTQTGTGLQDLELLVYFYGVGAVIVFLGSTALGRHSVQGLADARAAERRVVADRAVSTTAATPAAPAAATPVAPTAGAPVAPAAPAAATPAAEPGAAEEDNAARASARQAIAREQNDHAHRHFLRHRGQVTEPAREVQEGETRTRG